jgi:hypothetical protein
VPSLPVGVSFTRFPPGFRSFTRKESGLSRAGWREAKLGELAFFTACRLFAQGTVQRPSKVSWMESLHRGTVRFWEPRRVIRDLFNRKWRRLASVYPVAVGPERRCERLVLPVIQQVGGRGGLGFCLRPDRQGL